MTPTCAKGHGPKYQRAYLGYPRWECRVCNAEYDARRYAKKKATPEGAEQIRTKNRNAQRARRARAANARRAEHRR